MKQLKRNLQIVENERRKHQEQDYEKKFNRLLKEKQKADNQKMQMIREKLNQSNGFNDCKDFDLETNNNRGKTMKINPSNKSMLRAFIDYIEDDSKRTSWKVISNTSYDATRFSPRQRRQKRSQNSNRQNFKVFLEWYEMGETDLDFEIESFLKVWDEN